MNELNEAFFEYLTSFKELDVSDKRQEIIHSINEISALVSYWAEQENMPLSFLKSTETKDLNNGLESEDDFLEALLVYVENAKNLLGQYLGKKL
ncbi:MAG: hypothetical protein IKL65_06520 [Bacilli bacterium]|nr:hypothetical protein [Bacilli bacterium]